MLVCSSAVTYTAPDKAATYSVSLTLQVGHNDPTCVGKVLLNGITLFKGSYGSPKTTIQFTILPGETVEIWELGECVVNIFELTIAQGT